MRGLLKSGAVLVVVMFLSACTVPLPAERLASSSYYIHDRNNLFCAGMLDRTPLGARVPMSAIDPSREVLAGYDNRLFRGADPFPCNTSHMTLFTGKVRFDAPADLIARVNAAGGVLGATLIVRRRSTGVPIVGRDLSPAPRGNDSCSFVVQAAQADWSDGITQDGHNINFGDSVGVLSGGEPNVLGRFTNSDSSPTEIRITSSALTSMVQRWARGTAPNFGFTIKPDPTHPEIFRGLSNATCTGIFSDPVLEVVIPRDS